MHSELCLYATKGINIMDLIKFADLLMDHERNPSYFCLQFLN